MAKENFSVEQLVGQQIGEYTLLQLVTAGTLSAVYTARQAEDRQPVLLTVFFLPFDFLPPALTLFQHRFGLLAGRVVRLEHSHILPLVAYGIEHSYPFLVTPSHTGTSLWQLLQDGPFSPARVLRVLRQIAEALDYAHQHGVVHGSLHASTILVDREQNVVVYNFSVAQMFSARGLEENPLPYGHLLGVHGAFLGSAEYIAPELVEGAEPDERSDIYALGVLLYALLSGEVPFQGEDPLAVAFQHLEEAIAPVDLEDALLAVALNRIVQRALEKDPGRRYATAREMVADLERVPGMLENGYGIGQAGSDQGERHAAEQELREDLPFLGSMKLPTVERAEENASRRGLLSPSSASAQKQQDPVEISVESGSGGGWQLRPPIITQSMKVVGAEEGAWKPLASYPPLPDVFTIQERERRRQEEGETLALYQLPIEKTVVPVQAMDGREEGGKYYLQEESGQGNAYLDPYTMLATTSAMTSAQASMLNTASTYTPAFPVPDSGAPPLLADRGRRRTLTLLATGGVVTLGLLGLGGISLNNFLQKKARPGPKASVPVVSAKPKGVAIGKKSQGVNSAIAFTRPDNRQAALLIHLPNGNFVAYERACTHEQVPVDYDAKQHLLVCPRHHSIFDPQADGKVLRGPAQVALKYIPLTIQADGSITLPAK